MTKKDYVALAAAVYAARPAEHAVTKATWNDKMWASGCNSAREHIARSIVRICAADNPRFDKNKFYKACGLEWMMTDDVEEN